MTREVIRQKVLDLAAAVKAFGDWDAETDRPRVAEVEFDGTWKLVVERDEEFGTIKIHERLTGR